MDELYKEYGELMIQQEILSSRINVVKTKIAEQLNKQKAVEPEEAK